MQSYINSPSRWRCWKSFFFVHRSRNPIKLFLQSHPLKISSYVSLSLLSTMPSLLLTSTRKHQIYKRGISPADKVVYGMLTHQNPLPGLAGLCISFQDTSVPIKLTNKRPYGFQPPARSQGQLRPVSKAQLPALSSSSRPN
ncbi:hypothetical protein BDV36DRAFT_18313 [Aspergillus pseudocaelatus]|uniref:Uncharacterized protein n=1 Tax=Aspergillus pseudocaelatus TaxID=1825620 RepID=A0ABQ6WXV4_9EURO|nr:hypothetical protein BDV36DRAFT_18313 [Aspergillus pseudocaelatus]